MQQPPRQSTRSLRARRTNPALPGVPLTTTPVYVPAEPRQRWPQLPAGKRTSALRRVFFQLLLLGLLLSFCYWLLFPLFGAARPDAFLARALPDALPWLADLAWTKQFPALVAGLAAFPWLNAQRSAAVAMANLALLLLAVVGLLLWLAARVGQRAVQDRLSERSWRVLLALIWVFALLLGLWFVLEPGGLSQEALLAGLYGRLILVYHANPYLVSASTLAHDAVAGALQPGSFVPPQAGPLWLDLTVIPALLAQDDPVKLVLSLRAAALALHLLNVLLIWSVLGKLKAEVRLSATLFYAWNPALLLLGVGEAPMDLATLCFVLLGAFLLQRRSLLLSWACVILAALINPLCLLLLPLFLVALTREGRLGTLGTRGGRALWWPGCLFLLALIVTLAYAPYWSGLGLNGIAQRVGLAFWQDGAQSSLLAALKRLPFATWPPAAWLLTPHNWLLLPAVIVGGLLLLGLWIVDNLELALLFGSWIFLALFLFLPINTPWLVMLPLALSLASSSRRTALLAHLLAAGALVAYGLDYWPGRWDSQALVTIGLAALVWGWTLFFITTWQMTHQDDEEEQPVRRRLSLSRPSWPSRPAAWPSSRSGLRRP